MAQGNKQEKEFTVSADKLADSKREYFVRKGFIYYTMRWIPLIVIAVVVGLMIAHFRGYPVYEKILTPAMVKLGIPLPADDSAPVDGLTDPDGPALEPPPDVNPEDNLPLPGEINEDKR